MNQYIRILLRLALRFVLSAAHRLVLLFHFSGYIDFIQTITQFAHSANRQIIALVFKGFAQPAHGYVHRAVGDFAVIAPCLIKQLFAREHFAAVFHEAAQQGKFAAVQGNGVC